MASILITPTGKLIFSGRFPDPIRSDENGLLAIGGDLEPETLLSAYRAGIFPWSVDPISWWSPDPRAVMEINSFRLSRRACRYLRTGGFTFSFDKAFTMVMKGCAAPATGRRTTWISPQFIRAYTILHQMGHAHSVECWKGDTLVGGVYGVAIGGLFAGESMFHRVSNASTLSLGKLIEHLGMKGFVLFDSQVITPHTARLGALEIRRADYLKRLADAISLPCTF